MVNFYLFNQLKFTVFDLQTDKKQNEKIRKNGLKTF
jgi:hypothetical protein